MSGIEVAGIVLGAFPVAIWALEQYRDVARMMGFWYEIRLEYQRSSNELKFHRLSFVRNLKQLLLPLVPDDAQLQRLINEPGGAAWRDSVIQQALEARLQDSYHLYLEILGEMQRVMQELNEELAMDSDAVQSKVKESKQGKPRTPTASRLRESFDRSNRGYQVFRVKFSTGERIRSRLFSELQIYNDRLEKLMATSDVVSELEETRQQQLSSRPMNIAMTKFWSQADRVYKAFLGAWSCDCREHHQAQLILQHRTPTEKDFRMCLDSGIRSLDDKHPWALRSVILKNPGQSTEKTSVIDSMAPNLKEKDTRDSVPIAPAQPSEKMSLSTTTARIRKAKKTVHIVEPSGIPMAQTTTFTILTKNPSSVTIQPPTPPPNQAKDTLVTDLCNALGQNQTTVQPLPHSFGFVELEDDDTRYYIYPDNELPSGQTHISLGQIILGQVKPPLTRRQRYRLSLTIASSFVQLTDTAWLQTPWEKGGVFFSLNDHGHVPRLDLPFIVSRFDRPSESAKTQAADPTGGHDVAGIACLGILLLELCFGRAIEQHPSRLAFPYIGLDNQVRAALDLIAALEWLKEVNDEAGADYTDAVEWCLAGCRTLPSDGSWRTLMIERVVEPLERCYKYLG